MLKPCAGSWVRRGLAAAFTLVTTLLAIPHARALPPDERLVLAPDSIKIIHPTYVVTGVVSESETVAKAEILPAKEILISVPATAKNGAFGTVIVFGSNQLTAYEVCIGSCPAETQITSAKAACPSLTAAKDDNESVWVATIPDTKCLEALKKALEHATVPPGSLRLTLDEAPANVFIRGVLKDLQADPITKSLKAGYYGATLMISGQATTPQLGRALLHAYRHTVGRVSYDDSSLTLTDRPSPEKPQ